MECLRVQCEALTQFLPKSHLGGSADHGRLYCDPPDEEFLLGPQDPKVAKSDHSLERRKKANKTIVQHKCLIKTSNIHTFVLVYILK